jgi:hypothetical protein
MPLKKPEIIYIQKRITYKLLRDIILDEKLTENDTIILNTRNLDDIILEYLGIYNISMTFPHLLLGVLIRETEEEESVPFSRIGILRDDEQSIRESQESEFDYYEGEVIYRCGWCGNFVDEMGKELGAFKINKAIHNIKHHGNAIVKHRHGKCCPDGHH